MGIIWKPTNSFIGMTYATFFWKICEENRKIFKDTYYSLCRRLTVCSVQLSWCMVLRQMSMCIWKSLHSYVHCMLGTRWQEIKLLSCVSLQKQVMNIDIKCNSSAAVPFLMATVINQIFHTVPDAAMKSNDIVMGNLEEYRLISYAQHDG